jgi:hypothetical protein
VKPIKLIPALLAFVALASCEKLDSNKIKSTTISGQVRTYGTDEPIKGAPVTVKLWQEFDQHNQGFEEIRTVQTDENGFYNIQADLSTNERYFMSVEDYSLKLYIQSSWLSPSFSRRAQVAVGENQTINLEPVAYGYVNFHFKSLTPHQDDIFGYNLGGGESETFYGNVDVRRIWDYGAYLTHTAYFNLKRNGTWKNWNIPINAVPFDTIPMLIEF